MDRSKQSRHLHLLWRSGFGPSAEQLSGITDHAPAKWYTLIEKASLPQPVPLSVVTDTPDTVALAGAMAEEQRSPEEKLRQTTEQKRIAARKSAAELQELTLSWLDLMTNSPAQLREKMALFWHGHFACRINNSGYQQLLLQAIRAHAFGNFGTLLKEVSKSAAMLSFLNNQQNKKKHPNENFAREVLELFTMGRGHYTEQDIQEAARAFTGWSHDKDGQFLFNEKIHDTGSKTILGQSGNFNGDEVLDLILQQKQTAVFITEKIYRYFVNDQPDAQHVNWLAGRFFNNDYYIPGLMRDIFTSDWFFDAANIGTRIKSPVEYLVGIRRMLPMEIQNEAVQILLQRLLGQWLFNPPNVAGWPGGYAWIDSSSLMLRLRIPSLIRNEDAIDIKPKSNDDTDMGRKETLPVAGQKPAVKAGASYRILATINWQPLQQLLEQKPASQYYDILEQLLLAVPAGTEARKALLRLAGNPEHPAYLQSLVIALMSTPEYQLC